MKQRRQIAIVPSSSKSPQVAVKAGKSQPTPLSDSVLKQVAGGRVAAIATDLPHKNW